ncbi:hypothetical protein [Pseudothermotoga sp.]|uniref:hypothetical protein n=1 Tax=Pseudothermotoga sp. TaxID=2033661 RepID=UPI0031F66AE9
MFIWIKIVENGEHFIFELKYAKVKSIMKWYSYGISLFSALLSFVLSLFFENRRKLKTLIKESKMRKVHQATLEVIDKYLNGMKGRFERVLRQGDLIAKFGEDEFIVLDCDEKYVYRLNE